MRRLLLLVLAGLLGYSGFVVWGLPSRSQLRALAKQRPGETAFMRENRAAERREAQRGAWTRLGRISPHLIHAVLASEDQRFFGHEGVDWKAVEESLETNVERGRYARGGSTLTQQLARNLFLSRQKSLARKLRELVVAHWLERDLGKARILELYLNVIEWGDGIYGCDVAARRHYGKPPSALGFEEAAGLAAMIPNPRRFDPKRAPKTHARLTRRVLSLMRLSPQLAREARELGGAAPAAAAAPEAAPQPAEAAASPLPETPPPAPEPQADVAPPGPGLGFGHGGLPWNDAARTAGRRCRRASRPGCARRRWAT